MGIRPYEPKWQIFTSPPMKVLNVLMPYNMQPQSMSMQLSNVHVQCCHTVTNDMMDVMESTMELVYNIASQTSACLAFMITLIFLSTIFIQLNENVNNFPSRVRENVIFFVYYFHFNGRISFIWKIEKIISMSLWVWCLSGFLIYGFHEFRIEWVFFVI